MMKAITVRRRITGSASINNGIFPAVSVTITEQSKISPIPDARMTSPFRSLGIFRARR
jgi:hypothetical protein